MNKPIKWSSFAHNDLANLLDYLEAKWNKKSCLVFLNKLDFCVDLIEKNPNLFPFFNKKTWYQKMRCNKIQYAFL